MIDMRGFGSTVSQENSLDIGGTYGVCGQGFRDVCDETTAKSFAAKAIGNGSTYGVSGVVGSPKRHSFVRLGSTHGVECG